MFLLEKHINRMRTSKKSARVQSAAEIQAFADEAAAMAVADLEAALKSVRAGEISSKAALGAVADRLLTRTFDKHFEGPEPAAKSELEAKCRVAAQTAVLPFKLAEAAKAGVKAGVAAALNPGSPKKSEHAPVQNVAPVAALRSKPSVRAVKHAVTGIGCLPRIRVSILPLGRGLA